MRNILLQQSKKKDSIEKENIPFNTQVQLVSVEQFKTYKIPNDSLIFSTEKYKIIFNEIMIDQYDTTENVMKIKGILIY